MQATVQHVYIVVVFFSQKVEYLNNSKFNLVVRGDTKTPIALTFELLHAWKCSVYKHC